jgi:hypothetical protein
MTRELEVVRTVKEAPHLRVRIESKLLAKLEKSREKNGHTLTGEIVERLEQSFQTDARMANLQDFMEERLNNYKDRYDERYEVLRQQKEEAQEARAVAEKALSDIESKNQEAIKAATVIDVLLGANKLKSDFLRSAALELAEIPEDWLAGESNHRQLADRVVARFKSQQTREAGR